MVCSGSVEPFPSLEVVEVGALRLSFRATEPGVPSIQATPTDQEMRRQ